MSAHELNNLLIYIHPPLALTGYVLMSIFTLRLYQKKISLRLGALTWGFTLLGLITGMIWAQIAWGSYWSWDPKETLSLAMFLLVSGSMMAAFEGKYKLALRLSAVSLVSIVFTLLSSWLIQGLHSFLG